MLYHLHLCKFRKLLRFPWLHYLPWLLSLRMCRTMRPIVTQVWVQLVSVAQRQSLAPSARTTISITFAEGCVIKILFTWPPVALCLSYKHSPHRPARHHPHVRQLSAALETLHRTAPVTPINNKGNIPSCGAAAGSHGHRAEVAEHTFPRRYIGYIPHWRTLMLYY
jgi:hypothetical protein